MQPSQADRTAFRRVGRERLFPAEGSTLEIPNAFIGHTAQPTAAELASALGTTAGLWQNLLDWLATEHGAGAKEWKSISPKYGWSLRVKLKKRTIVYMGPCNGCFRVALVLGNKAVEAARRSNLPEGVMEAIDHATHYAEGTGVALFLKRAGDLAAVKQLVPIKLAN